MGPTHLFISAGTLSPSFGLALAGTGRAHLGTSKGPVPSDVAGGTWGVALAVALVA